jgi:hypothetical protein
MQKELPEVRVGPVDPEHSRRFARLLGLEPALRIAEKALRDPDSPGLRAGFTSGTWVIHLLNDLLETIQKLFRV